MFMKYINPNSRRGIVNKLADYILNQIDKTQRTRLQVTDFKTFYVINGETNSDKVLDLSVIKESFYSENKEILTSLGVKQINIIDIIEYKDPISQSDYHFDFYNSERPLYHQHTINELRSGLEGHYQHNHLNSINYTDKLELEFGSPHIYRRREHGIIRLCWNARAPAGSITPKSGNRIGGYRGHGRHEPGRQ
jgi:hypothetical protein